MFNVLYLSNLSCVISVITSQIQQYSGFVTCFVRTCSFVGVDACEFNGTIVTSLGIFLVLFQDTVGCIPVCQPIIY